MHKGYKNLKAWRKRIKINLCKGFDSKCGVCGYNKCLAALDFHHLDPSTKEFNIGPKMVSWLQVKNEAKKCILLCANCHREFHAEAVVIPADIARFDESKIDYIPYQTRERKLYPCQLCGALKKYKRKFCSIACANKSRGKVDWDSLDLQKMIVNDKLSFTAIGKKLNVSDNAVRKRARLLKLL